MSIFNKLRELFYGRPKKLVSYSSCVEHDQYGEDLAQTTASVNLALIARNWRYKRYNFGYVLFGCWSFGLC